MNAHDDFAAALQAGELLQPLPGLDLTQAYRIAALDIVKQRGQATTSDVVADAVSAVL